MKRWIALLLALLMFPVCAMADGADFTIAGDDVFSVFEAFTGWDEIGDDPEKLALFTALTLRDAEKGLKSQGFRISAVTDVFAVSLSGLVFVDAFDASLNWWLCPMYTDISVYQNDLFSNLSPEQTVQFMVKEGYFEDYVRITPEQLEAALAYEIPTVEGLLAAGGQENLFRNAEVMSVFRQGLARFSFKGQAGYIRPDGTLLMDDWNYANIFHSEHPYATVYRGTLNKYGSPDEGFYGLIDTEGQYVLPLEYDYIELGSEADYAYLRSVDGVQGYYHIGSGRFLWLEGYDYVAPRFYNGLIGVFTGTLNEYGSAGEGLWGFVNTEGELVIPQEWERVNYNWDDGLCVVKKNGKYGAIDQQGQLVVPCQWDSLDMFQNGLTIGEKDGKHYLVDRTGNVLYGIEGKYVYLKDEQYIAAYDSFDNEGGLLDLEGNVLIPRKWSDVQIYENGYVRLGRKDANGDPHYGLMDMATGRLVVDPEWDAFQECDDAGYYRVEQDGLFGYINGEHELFIAPQYEEAMLFGGGFACVKKDGQWQIINADGEKVF